MDPLVSEGELVIRPMLDADEEYERLSGWLNEPHVREWWDPDEPLHDLGRARAEFGPLLAAGSADNPCMIVFRGEPVGYIQFYPWSAFSDEAAAMDLPVVTGAWGLDVFIGEADLIGRGVGSAAVDLLCRYLFDRCRASCVMLAAAVDNARALRAYEKAGFSRAARVLDTDTRGGVRIESWLMVRRAS